MHQRTNYFPALTGIRAIAAYIVFIFHFNPFRNYAGEIHSLKGKLFSFCNELHIGVTIFFVLSGFLISLRYHNSVQLTKPWLFHYALNRFSRLFPMYAFVLGLTLAIVVLKIDYAYIKDYVYFPPFSKIVTILLNLTLLKGFSSSLKFSGIPQSWSLTVEECFYFTAPAVLVSTLPFVRRIVLYVAASFTIGLLLTAIGVYANYYGFFSSLNFLFNFTFFGRCLEFSLGMALAYFLTTKHVFSFKHFTLTGISSILFFIIALIFYPKVTWQGIVINNCLLPIGICSLFLGLICEHSYLRKTLETRLFELLGKSSYTFYLIHVGILELFVTKYITQNKFIYFLLVVILSSLLFKIVEQPCHKALRKLGNALIASTIPAG